jgi:hypothetical protein
VFYALIATIQGKKEKFNKLSELLFKKYYILMARLNPPKDLILSLLPMLTGKAILLVIDQKVTEKLKVLIDDGQLGDHTNGACSSENMIYLFCLGLFNSSFV